MAEQTTGPGPQDGFPPAGEVSIDGNTFSSDGAGNMSFSGADGSSGSMSPDGGATFSGPEGSGVAGQLNPDGSGSWTGPDGNTTEWGPGEPPNDLPGMEMLPDMGAVANSPEVVQEFGPPPPGMMDGGPGMGPGEPTGDMSGVTGDMTGCTGDMTGCTGDVSGCQGDMSGFTGDMT